MKKLPRAIVALKENYFFWISIIFYAGIYFSVNNKTLLGIFIIFLLIFLKKFKKLPISLFILYLLFLPFQKGKTFEFVLIPSWILGTDVPYSYGFTITFADLAFLGLFALILKEAWNRRKFVTFKLQKIDICFLGFLVFVFISILFSQFQLVSFLAFLKLIRIVAVFYIIRIMLLDKGIKKIVIQILASSLIFQGVWASLQFLLQRPLGRAIEYLGGPFSAYGQTAVEEKNFFRSQGTFDHPNTLGSFLVMFLLFFVVQIFNRKLNLLNKKIFFIALITGFAALVFSASRSSWVIFVVLLFFLIIFLKSRNFGFPFLINKKMVLGLVTIMGLGSLLIIPRLEHLYVSLADTGSFYYRGYLLEKAWLLARESPFGIGLATFPAILIEKFGFFSWPAPVHNLGLEILVETGIFSLVFFVLLVIFSYKKFFIELKVMKKEDFFFKTGAIFASLGFLGVSQFYPFFWSSGIFEYFWLFLGIMLY